MEAKTIGAPTSQLAIMWGFTFIVFLFFMLANLEKDIELKSTIIFIITYLVSIVGVLVIRASARGQYLTGAGSFFFFNEQLKFKTFIAYMPLGVLVAFALSALAHNIGLDSITAGLVALAGSGFAFIFVLIKSKSIIVPWISHGVFNVIVLLIQKTESTGEFITASLPIPEIGIPLGDINQVVTESIFQFSLVAPAEEHYKVLIISVFLAVFKDSFANALFKVVFSGILAVLIWAFLHLPNALT